MLVDDLIEIVKNTNSLHSLNISKCYNITNTSIIEIVRQLTSLQVLSIWECIKITDITMNEIAKHCNNNLLSLTF